MYTEYGQGMFRKRLTLVIFNFLVSIEVNFSVHTFLSHNNNGVIDSFINSQTRHWMKISGQVQLSAALPLWVETQFSSEKGTGWAPE